MRNYIENKIRINRVIKVNLYVNHNVKKESGQYFVDIQKWKARQKIMGRREYKS